MIIRLLIALLCMAGLAACAGLPLTEEAPAAGGISLPTPSEAAGLGAETALETCLLSEPVWVQPPEDSAVQGTPGYGYYFVNDDRSIWASAWWTGQAEDQLRAGGEGLKVGWFRPAGATLDITGARLDAPAPPLEAHAACCYPTRFQASGLYFPTQGCWEVTARADEAELTFVVWVDP